MVGCHLSVSAKIHIAIIQLENLAAQKSSPELNDVMIKAVKIIKYIRDRILHLRVFEALCERMDLQHQHLIFYACVIWFLKGRLLARLFI